MKKNLVLTGMMGSGKTSVGKSLSKKLNMEFGDTDSIIENKMSLSISDIFNSKGEEYFRKIEEAESIKLVQKKSFVVALGGGAFLNDAIRKEVKKNCISVWLEVNIDELFRRTKNSRKRPLLNNINNTKDLKKFYEKRKKVYALSDYKINCDNKTEDAIIDEIIGIYENS